MCVFKDNGRRPAARWRRNLGRHLPPGRHHQLERFIFPCNEIIQSLRKIIIDFFLSDPSLHDSYYRPTGVQQQKKNNMYYINQPVDLGREPRWAGPNTRGGGDGRIFWHDRHGTSISFQKNSSFFSIQFNFTYFLLLCDNPRLVIVRLIRFVNSARGACNKRFTLTVNSVDAVRRRSARNEGRRSGWSRSGSHGAIYRDGGGLERARNQRRRRRRRRWQRHRNKHERRRWGSASTRRVCRGGILHPRACAGGGSWNSRFRLWMPSRGPEQRRFVQQQLRQQFGQQGDPAGEHQARTSRNHLGDWPRNGGRFQ